MFNNKIDDDYKTFTRRFDALKRHFQADRMWSIIHSSVTCARQVMCGTRADTSTRELKNTSQVLLAYISRTAIKA